MNFLRRLAFVFGLIPCMIFVLFWWICTGNGGIDTIRRFDEWGTSNDEVA